MLNKTIWSVLSMAVVMSGCPVGQSGGGRGDDGEAVARERVALTLERTGSFDLAIPADKAFPLFTALGEKLWVPGWEPRILHGDGYEVGTVWTTSRRGHSRTTYWLVADYDVTKRYARYVCTTPEASTGTVAVRVAPNDAGGSTVEVTYRLTGLSDIGEREVRERLDPSEYATMMEQWRTAIEDSRDAIDAHIGM